MSRLIKVVNIRTARLVTSDSALGTTELDLGPYINVGKRQMLGVWSCSPASASTDTDGTYDNKLQESATTADTDFSDITGAGFTQVAATDSASTQVLSFVVNKRYIRSLATLGGTVPVCHSATSLILTGRFDT